MVPKELPAYLNPRMGGMGEVYLCLDKGNGLPYALKTFQRQHSADARLRQAFEVEVAHWVVLEKHPNIVRCFAMEILDNRPFMVLEWVNGGDLAKRLRRLQAAWQTMPLDEALRITLDICRALAHAEEKVPGIVHHAYGAKIKNRVETS